MFFAQPSQLSHFGPFLDFFFVVFFSKCLSPLYCPSPSISLSDTPRSDWTFRRRKWAYIIHNECKWGGGKRLARQCTDANDYSSLDKKKEIWGRAEFITFHGKVNPANTRAFCQVKKKCFKFERDPLIVLRRAKWAGTKSKGPSLAALWFI